MKFKTLLVLGIIALTLSNCKRKTECPAFNNSDLQYIAYKAHDTITFVKDQEGAEEKYSIIIKQILASESFTQKCERDLYNQCPCINYVQIIASNNNESSEYIFLKMEKSNVSEMQVFNYQLLDYKFNIDFDNELMYASQIPYMDYLPSLTINNIVYSNIAVITNLDNSSSNIYKVYLNKKNGIIRYIDKFQNTWTLK